MSAILTNIINRIQCVAQNTEVWRRKQVFFITFYPEAMRGSGTVDENYYYNIFRQVICYLLNKYTNKDTQRADSEWFCGRDIVRSFSVSHSTYEFIRGSDQTYSAVTNKIKRAVFVCELLWRKFRYIIYFTRYKNSL